MKKNTKKDTKKDTNKHNNNTKNILVYGMPILLGGWYTFLFVGHELGINVFLFTIAYYGLVFVTFFASIKKNRKKVRYAWILVILSIINSLYPALFTQQGLVGIHILLLAFLLPLTAYYLTHSHNYDTNSYDIFMEPFSLVGEILTNITHYGYGLRQQTIYITKGLIPNIISHIGPNKGPNKGSHKGDAKGDTKGYSKGHNNYNEILIGVITVLPVLAVIIALLASADPLFKKIVGSIPSSLGRIIVSIPFSAEHITLFVCITALVGGLFFCINQKKGSYNASLVKQKEQDSGSQLRHSSAIMSALTLLFAVYLLFIGIQYVYLFSHGATLPDGITYAAYAIQGFNQLIAVTCINSLIILAINRFRVMSSTTVKVGLYILLSMNAMLLYIAWYKMGMYVDSYGLTYKRILTQTWMIGIAVLLCRSCIKIHKPALPTILHCGIGFYAYITIISFANLAGIIAVHNIQAAIETQKLDIYYLYLLQKDGYLAVYHWQKNNPEQYKQLANEIQQKLDLYLQKPDTMQQSSPWQSRNRNKAAFYHSNNHY